MGNYGNAIHEEWAPESIFQHSRADLDNIETARRIYKRKVQLKGGPMIAVCASPKSNSVCGFGAQQRKMVRSRRLRIIMIRTRGITLLIRNKFIPPPSMVFGWFKNFVWSDIERMPPNPVHHLLCGIPFLVVNCDILFPFIYILGPCPELCREWNRNHSFGDDDDTAHTNKNRREWGWPPTREDDDDNKGRHWGIAFLCCWLPERNCLNVISLSLLFGTTLFKYVSLGSPLVLRLIQLRAKGGLSSDQDLHFHSELLWTISSSSSSQAGCVDLFGNSYL